MTSVRTPIGIVTPLEVLADVLLADALLLLTTVPMATRAAAPAAIPLVQLELVQPRPNRIEPPCSSRPSI